MNLLEGVDQTPDIRAELEAKWKDKPAEEVLKAKVESDLYIKTLEARTDELRKDYLKMQEELQTRANLQALVDKLQEKQVPPDNRLPDTREQSPQLNPKDIESLLDNKFKAYEASKQEEQNYNIVLNKLVEKYGQNYRNLLSEQIKELGMSEQDLNVMARTKPTMVIKALGLDEPRQRETFQSPPRSNQRNDNFAPKGGTKRDWNYYQDMLKGNPKLYLDRKIAIQMHNDAIELGDAFGMPKDEK